MLRSILEGILELQYHATQLFSNGIEILSTEFEENCVSYSRDTSEQTSCFYLFFFSFIPLHLFAHLKIALTYKLVLQFS